MLDIKAIRKDPQGIERQLQTKEPTISLLEICQLDDQIRKLKTRVEELKAQRNLASQDVAKRKKEGADITDLLKELASQADTIASLDESLKPLEAQFHQEMSKLPNLPLEGILTSQDPKDNIVLKEVGQKKTFNFPFKNHVELNEKLQLFDFKRGAKIAGASWPVYKGMGARLEWALLNYMISVHLKNGFEQWIPPVVVKPEILFGSGQLPKFENQQFKLHDADFHLYLIPTAEVPLNGLHFDEVLDEENLPLKYIAYTPCFRREAGAAGAQERGLIRTHQFNKVEMFSFATPENSHEVFEEMLQSAEEILQGLGLHYRNTLLVTGDMSFAAGKTIDIEIYLPGQNRYYEVSSVSHCTNFQARRSNTRFKKGNGKAEFVHTLNGSGLATSRLMVGLLENNQREDGSVEIPEVLRPYLGGISSLDTLQA